MSVVQLFRGHRGEVVEVLVGPLVVEPVDPVEGLDLDVVDVAPRALTADEFVLERPDGGPVTISPSTYYEQVDKAPTRAQLRDARVSELIGGEREHPGYGRFASTLGSRKMWIRLRGNGHDVARCTVERLMRVNG